MLDELGMWEGLSLGLAYSEITLPGLAPSLRPFPNADLTHNHTTFQREQLHNHNLNGKSKDEVGLKRSFSIHWYMKVQFLFLEIS